MASVQVEETAETYYEKNKEVVDAIKEETKSLIVVPDPVLQRHATAAVGIKNQTGWTLNLSADKSWFGKAYSTFPIPLQINFKATGAFLHSAQITDHNSIDMGAVVYAMGDSAYGCLIAWSVNKRNPLPIIPPITYNQVYVKAGKIEELTKWDDVKAKLNRSGIKSYSYDKETETVMYAKITPTGNHAELSASCAKRQA